MGKAKSIAKGNAALAKSAAKRAASKQAKLAEHVGSFFEDDQFALAQEQVSHIIGMLWKQPHVIPQVLSALKKDLFTQTRNPKDWFHSTYTNLYRLPQQFILTLLPQLSPQHDEMKLKMAKKKDKQIYHKMFYACLRLGPQFPFFSHEKQEFTDIAIKRHKDLRNPLQNLQLADDMTIDWQKLGCFQLHPPLPETEQNKEKHIYTHISLWGLSEVEIPSEYNVHGKWSISFNWSYKQAKLSSGKRVSVRCLSLLPKSYITDAAAIPYQGVSATGAASEDEAPSSQTSAIQDRALQDPPEHKGNSDEDEDDEADAAGHGEAEGTAPVVTPAKKRKLLPGHRVGAHIPGAKTARLPAPPGQARPGLNLDAANV